jgi:hypothetical protein
LADQGQRDRARALLQPIFEQFTEGSDTVDLKAAERLLATLASGSTSRAKRGLKGAADAITGKGKPRVSVGISVVGDNERRSKTQKFA